jgi:hypothetical protein
MSGWSLLVSIIGLDFKSAEVWGTAAGCLIAILPCHYQIRLPLQASIATKKSLPC